MGEIMSAGKIGGAIVGLAGTAFVVMQFAGTNVEASTKPVEGSRLKKTLTNAGLYPEPEKNKTLKTRPSGDMALCKPQHSTANALGDATPERTRSPSRPL